MTEFTRIYNRFTGYSTADCDCTYCLYKGTKKRPCLLDECCCMEERQMALEREQGANSGLTARLEIMGPPREPSGAGRVGRGGATEQSGCPTQGGRSDVKFATTTCRA